MSQTLRDGMRGVFEAHSVFLSLKLFMIMIKRENAGLVCGTDLKVWSRPDTCQHLFVH